MHLIPSHKPKKKRQANRKKLVSVLSVVAIIALGCIWRCQPPPPPPPPPPIPGFVSLVPPVDDSLPVGKTFIKGGLSGSASNNFTIYRSWDTLVKSGEVGDTLSANSKIRDILNASFGGEKNGFEVVNVGGINYYSSNDYSQLDLPDSGSIVVSAAIAARKFSFKTFSSVKSNTAITAIKKVLPNAQFSSDGDVTVVASGTGLVVGVKLLQVIRHDIDTTNYKIESNNFQYIDPFTKQYNYLSFSSAKSTRKDWPNITLKFATSHIKVQGTSRIEKLLFRPESDEISVSGLGGDGHIEVGQSSPQDLKMPRRMLGAQEGNKIYMYQIVENNCQYRYLNKGPKSRNTNWNLVDFQGLTGSFRVTEERWTFEIGVQP